MPEQLPRLKFLHLFTGEARHSPTTTKILSKKKKAHTKRTQPPQSPSVLRLQIPTELPQNSRPNSKKTPHRSECRPPIACKVRRIFHSAARNSEAVKEIQTRGIEKKEEEVTINFFGSMRWTNLRRHGACCSRVYTQQPSL